MTLHLINSNPDHGYEIIQRMRHLPGFDVTESAIYPILSRFLREGMLTVEPVASPAGPRKKIYHITALGRTRLRTMRAFLGEITTTLISLTND